MFELFLIDDHPLDINGEVDPCWSRTPLCRDISGLFQMVLDIGRVSYFDGVFCY